MLFLFGIAFFYSFAIMAGVLFFVGKNVENKTFRLLAIGIISFGAGIIAALGSWVPLNFFYNGIWWITIPLLMMGLSLAIFKSSQDQVNVKKAITVGLGAVIIVCMLLFTSTSFFRPDAVSNVVQFQKVGIDFLKQIEPKNVRLVPKQTAYMHAKKVMGSVKKDGKIVGSQLKIDVDHATIQRIRGKKYWVFPLGYKAIFAQSSFGDIPGFIIVNAYTTTIKRPAQFIDTNPVTGEKYHIRYSMEAYFGRWAKRKLLSTFPTAILTDFSFEVDDEWKPHIVATQLKPAVGFGKPVPVGVKVLDVQSGQTESFSKGNIPKWIDRVVPSDILAERINEKGMWHNGRLAAMFTSNDLWNLTEYAGSEMFFVEDGVGNTYWISGVTSQGTEDDSIISIIIASTREFDKIYWVDIPGGGTEEAVINTIQASLGINQKVWTPKLPLLYNIYGQLVWVSTIIDGKGYPVRYGIVDAKNISHKVVEETFQEALNKFFKKQVYVNLKKNSVAWEGKISRFNFVGNSLYLFANKKIWICDVTQLPICGLPQQGDIISVRGFLKEAETVQIEKFSIKGVKLEFKKTPRKEVIEQTQKPIEDVQGAREFDKLTPEQKRKLLEKVGLH